jgi:hypothetical protein
VNLELAPLLRQQVPFSMKMNAADLPRKALQDSTAAAHGAAIFLPC